MGDWATAGDVGSGGQRCSNFPPVTAMASRDPMGLGRITDPSTWIPASAHPFTGLEAGTESEHISILALAPGTEGKLSPIEGQERAESS